MYNQSGPLRYVVKYKVWKLDKSLIKHHFSSPLQVLIGVLAKFHEEYFTNNSNWTLRLISSVKKNLIRVTTTLRVGSL